MSDVIELSVEEEAIYDMSDAEFEDALSKARAEQDQGSVGDEISEAGVETEEQKEDNPGSETEVEDAGNPDDNEDEDEKKDEKELEQSTTDSNNDGDNKDGKDPDKETNPDDEDGEDEKLDKSEPDVVKPKTYKYKASGQEFEFTEAEIKERFGQVFGQSMNYTQKMQELKPWRTTISALEDNKVSHADIELMIDVMKGDKGAMNKLMEKTGVNPMELDSDSDEQKYQPNQYGQSELEIEINDIVSDIGRDPEYTITQDVLSNRWDQNSRDTFLDNPSLIRKLHIDVKSGDFDVINAEATKLKLYDGNRLSDIEYYAQAAQKQNQSKNQSRVVAEQAEEANRVKVEADRQIEADKQARIASVKSQQEKQAEVEANAEKRKAATVTNKTSGQKTVVDYLDDDDVAFDEWYSKLQASQ